MKKIIAFILALTMIFALCACGSSVEPSVSDSQSTEPTDSTETEEIQTENDNTSDEEIEKQEFDYAEQLAGLWLCTDHVNSDKTVDFMFLTDDGYILRRSFDVSTNEFFLLSNFITLIGDSPSSENIAYYFSLEGIVSTIEEAFTSELYGVNKYEINNDEMVITYPDGETEVLDCSYYPIISMEEFAISSSDEEVYYSRYNWHMEDSYRYFVGNWIYEQIEWSEDKYGIVDTKEFHDSGSLFFGENFRVNESNGNIGGWGYNDGILEIDGSHYDVIILSHNKFILYDEYDSGSSIHYEFSVFDRA